MIQLYVVFWARLLHFLLIEILFLSDICRAGSYSYTTVAPCSPCPTGTYQGHVASVTCSPCPAGTWTQSEGSTSMTDCIGTCVV